ncbi:MAG TPA: hypothetical protein VEA99_10095 [Gemmatimonadaceae bacterium]|nr:hypothetical protein [Gemmatimonadaceae bacterium]
MRYYEEDRDAGQLAELLELAGSAEALLEAVAELELLKGRRPELVELVNLLIERQHEAVIGATRHGAF